MRVTTVVMEWDDSLSIDHGEIDRDHKYLFTLTNRIVSAGNLGHSKQDIMSMLCEYIDYISIHFSREEYLMSHIGYPDIELHFRAHNSFFERLCELVTRYERGESGIHCRIAAFIGTYSFNHIDVYDRRLAEFCQSLDMAETSIAPRHSNATSPVQAITRQ